MAPATSRDVLQLVKVTRVDFRIEGGREARTRTRPSLACVQWFCTTKTHKD